MIFPVFLSLFLHRVVVLGKDAGFHETDNGSAQRQQGLHSWNVVVELLLVGIDGNDREQGELCYGNRLSGIGRSDGLATKDADSTQRQHGQVEAADDAQHVILKRRSGARLVVLVVSNHFAKGRQILASGQGGEMDQAKGWQHKVLQQTHLFVMMKEERGANAINRLLEYYVMGCGSNAETERLLL